MLENQLTQTICNLIDLKYEGNYWDFKQEHHSKENNHKLLHDIICLANNLEISIIINYYLGSPGLCLK